MRLKILALATIWFGFAVASTLPTDCSAATATVYTYTGNPFTVFVGPPAFDMTMRISGSFTMPDALPPNQLINNFFPSSFSFSDGLSSTFNPITNLNGISIDFARVQTDSLGNISQW